MKEAKAFVNGPAILDERGIVYLTQAIDNCFLVELRIVGTEHRNQGRAEKAISGFPNHALYLRLFTGNCKGGGARWHGHVNR
jgi:hypothetical protein